MIIPWSLLLELQLPAVAVSADAAVATAGTDVVAGTFGVMTGGTKGSMTGGVIGKSGVSTGSISGP